MSAIAHLKLLINLAQIDGSVAERERNYILNIGKANGVAQHDIELLFTQRHPLIIPDALTAEQKFDYIFSLVKLMKIDERLYREEIQYCARIAARLGYDQHVMFDLMLHVKSAAMAKDEVSSLEQLTRKYLN